MTRIWTGTADVVSGYTTVVLTGDPLTAANCPSDATIVLAGATYFVAEADYPTMTVELTRAYEAGDGTVSAEIDPMTPLTGSVVALAKSIADYDAQLALLEARGLGLFYETLGQTGANDPEPGNIARNASTWAASTALYLDVLDASEAHHDQSARIDQLATGDSLVVESLSTGAYAAFTVNGSITAPSGWRTVPVAYVGGAGMLADGESVRVISLKRGPAGADGVDGTNGTDGADGADGTGVPAGGSTGQALVKISGTDLDTGWAARREVLTANRTYYVRTDGSDSNNGLANTSGGAFLTIQKAINTIVGNLDLAGFTVTIQVGDGTYTGAASLSAPWTGGGAVTIQGNSSTPANVLVSVTGNAMANSGVLPGTLTVKDMKLASSGGALLLNTGVGLINFSNIDFGSSAGGQIVASGPAARIGCTGNYRISGGGTTHMEAVYGGLILVNGQTVTISGTPAFGSAFAFAWRTGTVDAYNNTYSGAATGVRYNANMNGVIVVGGAGATYLPGNSAGSTATGGQYA